MWSRPPLQNHSKYARLAETKRRIWRMRTGKIANTASNGNNPCGKTNSPRTGCDMPETHKRNQNRRERRKPIIIFAVVGIILVGIFPIIIFFFRSYLRSGAPFKSLNDFDPPTRLANNLAPSSGDSGGACVWRKCVAFELRQV
jgi:hypothetical protein